MRSVASVVYTERSIALATEQPVMTFVVGSRFSHRFVCLLISFSVIRIPPALRAGLAAESEAPGQFCGMSREQNRFLGEI